MDSQDDAILVAAVEAVEAVLDSIISDSQLVAAAEAAELLHFVNDVTRELGLDGTNLRLNQPNVQTDAENLDLSQLLDLEIECQDRLNQAVTIPEDYADDLLEQLFAENDQSWECDDFDLDLLPEVGPIPEVQHGAGRPRTKVPLFTVKRRHDKFYKNFGMQGVRFALEIATPNPKMRPEDWVTKLITDILAYFISNSDLEIKSGDMIGLELNNSEYGTRPVYIKPRRADQLSAYVILDTILNILNSNEDFFMNGFLSVHFDHIQMPNGSGNPRITRTFGETNSNFILKKACYIKYANPGLKNPEDEYCLPYALVISRAHVQAKIGEITRTESRTYHRGYKKLRKAAVELCKEAGVNMEDLRGGCSFAEVVKFQRILPNYQIVIYGADSKTPQFTDKRYRAQPKINIMLHDNHYTAMRSVQACFGSKYICPDCHTHTTTKAVHFCKYSCSQCQSSPICDSKQPLVPCSACHRNFYGHGCYLNHLKSQGGRKSVCDTKKNCSKCKCFIEKNHVCGKRRCTTCEKFVKKENHFCHMPKYTTKRKDSMNVLYVMYDLETQQDTPLSSVEPNKFKHVPNLCISQSACLKCIEDPDFSKSCSECGVREHIYDSENCVADFMEYIVSKHNEKGCRTVDGKRRKVSKFDQIVVIAHNASGFDSQFILRYIYESGRFKNPGIIMNGTKAVEISLDSRTRFIDSLGYFQVGLSKLPALFGFEGSKGNYPHLFNTPEHKDYEGPIPAKHYYGYDSMMPKVRKEFDEWYEPLSKDSNYIFNNKNELIDYCKQDVTILRKACIQFLREFWEKNNIDPFVDACTIAGACNRSFRMNHLQEDTIGVIPTNGYRLADNQSKSALRWLYLMEFEHGIKIQHAGRDREVQLPGIGRVDGYFENDSSRTVFEFDGCYWHGCIDCYHEYGTAGNSHSKQLRQRRDATLAKHRAIIEAGYNLVVKRECDFWREMEENPALAELISADPIIDSEALDPRDAFFGGRTNAITLYFLSDGLTKMHYYDICSLYPFINKVSKCPIGRPKVHVGADCDKVVWQDMDGLMKVTVSPPRGLAFPVLPSRMHSKLMFVLCKACGEKLNQCPCDHNEKERQFTGTWVMDEVKLAVSKGYEIVKIHELWVYKVTQYDPSTKTGGLFSGYVNTFLKMKVEASDWPKSCKTPKQKQAYIKEFYEREGVLLDETKIMYNPGLRQMAKIMLNSFWGRFGMRPDLIRTKLVKTAGDLQAIFLNPKLEVQSLLPVNDEHILVNYREKEEARDPNNTTNVVIAAFTTAYARMELYKYMDLMGYERVYYFDTDSLLFTSKDGEVMPEIGNFLGQMTDEIEGYGPGSYIIEFVSGGPKNYAYRVYTPSPAPYYSPGTIHTVVKVKGITLNYENSLVLNFDLLKNMIVDEKIDSIELSNNAIRRSNVAEVFTTRVKKTYRVNYTKRQKTGLNHTTVPYGY